MKIVYMMYIPGAGGNFFARCLTLLNHAYSIRLKKETNHVTSVAEKLKRFSYNSVNTLDFTQRHWVDFERNFTHYHLPDLPDSTKYYVVFGHVLGLLTRAEFAGPDDEEYFFYIDASDNFEWCVLNALYKNSHMAVEYLIEGEQLRLDPKVHNISSKNIVANLESFMLEFKKVCEVIGHALTLEEESAIIELYNQWKLTTLDYSQFDKFKELLGFKLSLSPLC
jgi:hypothetical protein